MTAHRSPCPWQEQHCIHEIAGRALSAHGAVHGALEYRASSPGRADLLRAGQRRGIGDLVGARGLGHLGQAEVITKGGMGLRLQ